MRAVPFGLALALVACGGASEPAPGHVVLRHQPAVGSSIRYDVVVRSVPGDVPGRTVTGEGSLRTVEALDGGAHRQELALTTVYLAGEGGSTVEAEGGVRAALVRDPRHGLVSAPPLEGEPVAGAADLVRAMIEDGLMFPEAPVGVGDTWAMSPIARTVLEDVVVSIPREARLEAVDGGVAAIAIAGAAAPQTIERAGARITVEATTQGRARVRVADGLLVERDSRTEVTLTAVLADGVEVGRRTHHFQVRIERVAGTMPAPATHDWRPDRVDASCEARLRAMGRRFERAPSAVDVGPLPVRGVRLLEAADGRDLAEEGPVLIATDEETMAGALAGAELGRAVVVYVAVPETVDDQTVRAWLADVPSFVELRRVVRRPVDPPAPNASEAVGAVAGAMRERGDEAWEGALAPRLALCAGAATELGERGTSPALRGPLLVALRRCGCEVSDLADLEALLDLRLGGPELGWIPVQE